MLATYYIYIRCGKTIILSLIFTALFVFCLFNAHMFSLAIFIQGGHKVRNSGIEKFFKAWC